MDARLIQQQVLIGSDVTFFLTTGQAVSGILTELSRSFVVVESQGKKTTILLGMIGGWQVEEEQNVQLDLLISNGVESASKPATPTSSDAKSLFGN